MVVTLKMFGDERADETKSRVFARAGTTSILYTMLSNEREWADTGLFNANITFEGGDEPRLEMADLLARESMKEFDRKVAKSNRPTQIEPSS